MKRWDPSRREFLGSLGGGLVAASGSGAQPPPAAAVEDYRPATGFAAEPLESVRIGFVGVGLQGGSHVRNFLRLEGVEVRALCDIDEPRAREVAAWVEAADRPAPALYTRGEEDFRRMCERQDLDLVFNATPWRWHVPVCVAAMKSGKHAAVEVPAAITLEGCWRLVETAEKERRHCVMMENCCYGRSELMALRMVRAGLFGELLHGEGAYIHDLRGVKFSDHNEGLWRLEHSVERNGNLYPTHGLGPIAQHMSINRGDQFDFLVSMSSKALGLDLYARERLPEEDPRRARRYALGDMNSSLIRTKNGRTILLQHDTTTPRPYSRLHLIQGTRGAFAGYPDRIFVEGRNPGHDWESPDGYRQEFEHPLWRMLDELEEKGGHGGMDFLEDYRLVEALRRGRPTDMDVYDAAALSAVVEMSEVSVREGSRPVEFPDFTRGRWRVNLPVDL